MLVNILIDGDGSACAQTILRRDLKAKVNFLTVSEPPRLGLVDGLLGGSSSRGSWALGHDPYHAARSMVSAALDEANDRALWAKYGL